MTGALTPAQALDHLLDISSDVRDAVLLSPSGRRLAGNSVLGGSARELLAGSDAPEIEVGTARGRVFASRSAQAALVAVTQRSALPALVLYDLRVVLARLRTAA